MIRKVIQSNPTTMVISLPKKWVTSRNIKKGDELQVIEKPDRSLQIGGGNPKLKEIEVTLTSSHYQYISGLIRNLYIHGYDIVKVNYHKKNDVIQIAELLNYLIAYEIVEQTKNYCIIKNISTEKKEDYEVFLRKIFQNVLYLAEIFQDSLTKPITSEQQKKIEDLLRNSTKFSCYTRRILQKFNLTQTDAGLANYVLVTLLHMIARNYWYTQKYLNQHSFKIQNETVEYAKSLQKTFRHLYETYYDNSKDINKLHEQIERLIAKANKFILKCSAHNRVIVKYLSESSRILLTTVSKIQMVHLTNSKQP